MPKSFIIITLAEFCFHYILILIEKHMLIPFLKKILQIGEGATIKKSTLFNLKLKTSLCSAWHVPISHGISV